MLKNKKYTTTKCKDGIGCDEDLNTTQNVDNETIIIGRKVVAYFNDPTKQTYNEHNKPILNRILNDPSIRELVDFDGLNSNLICELVNNLLNSFVNMSK